MPQFVIIGMGVLLLLRETFDTFFKSKEVKIITVAVVVYYMYQRLAKTETKDSTLLNSGSDMTTQDAIALHGAMHPVFPQPAWGVYLPDGTNETEAYRIAKKYVGNFNSIAAKYKILYERDLAIELQAEGIYSEFMAIINGPAVSSSPAIASTNNVSLIIGREYTVKGGWVVRSLIGSPERNTLPGEKFTVIAIEIKTSKGGVLSDWVKVQYLKNYITLPTEHYISIGAFNPY